MTDEQIIQEARSMFGSHPGVDCFYATQDGLFFRSLHDAHQHARGLAERGVATFMRDQLDVRTGHEATPAPQGPAESTGLGAATPPAGVTETNATDATSMTMATEGNEGTDTPGADGGGAAPGAGQQEAEGQGGSPAPGQEEATNMNGDVIDDGQSGGERASAPAGDGPKGKRK